MTPNRQSVLVAGSWIWPWYEQACASALEALGCEVETFSTTEDIVYRTPANTVEAPSVFALVQHHLLMGPAIRRTNERLVQVVSSKRPSLVFLHNCTNILPKTISVIKQAVPDTTVVLYANDCPFATDGVLDYWRHFKACIPLVDLCLAYRTGDEREFERAGARRISRLRSYFVAGEDYRVEVDPANRRFVNDVVFAGHFEPDGRAGALEALARRGHRVGLFGAGWRLSRQSPLDRNEPIVPALDDQYRQAISGAKIALCFLSKRNRDTYTRRNFQIPAMGTFMLSEYSDDLAALFAPGVDAEFFQSQEELLEKVAFYLAHDETRERIAAAGRSRVLRDGHEIRDRMRTLLELTAPGALCVAMPGSC